MGEMRPTQELPSPGSLREMFDYDADTGLLYHRLKRHGVYVGTVAGSRSKWEIKIKIFGRFYGAHRIIWAMTTGSWPENFIDHINGNPHDNRLINLREATPAQNCWNTKRASNNTAGFKGVTFERSTSKWRACITHHGDRFNLGAFDTAEDAYAAYCAAARKMRGEFARVA